MVTLTRINSQEVVLNVAHIVTVEATPDTIVTLFGGDKIMVKESPAEVVDRATHFLQRVGGLVLPLQILKAPTDGGE